LARKIDFSGAPVVTVGTDEWAEDGTRPSSRAANPTGTAQDSGNATQPLNEHSAIARPETIVDSANVRHNMTHMKTATVRELRNEFPRIEAWVNEGESVRISKRGKAIATLVPIQGNVAPAPSPGKVDIMARLRETWGERVFTMEQVEAMRADELAGDLG
jgi:antitoxin (DNA-binding transcriptional repressor) of toxin-antitoxin stability system